jgi:hypothetical protein
MLYEPRPRFNSADEYAEYVGNVLAAGKTPIEPATREELEAVIDQFPEYATRWLPSPDNLALINLPAHFGRDVEPFGELYRERLLVTLQADDEFCLALAHLVNRGGQ